MINEVQMTRESCVTYLGVSINSTLSWKNQVEYVSKKNYDEALESSANSATLSIFIMHLSILLLSMD